ncbi:Uncharacterized protein TCM_001722 [Theobroma cacao]|uniref:Uncharacterized protein n=1 Tax=Theobroma cacao TaxID=3641 RepID=A0A061DL99_THECC|nr:Uncharacterized protein TCM_001722 [Theobroma cacao]
MSSKSEERVRRWRSKSQGNNKATTSKANSKNKRRRNLKTEAELDTRNDEKGSQGEESASDPDVRKRNSIIRREAEEIWEWSKKVGLTFREEKEDVLRKIMELEAADRGWDIQDVVDEP